MGATSGAGTAYPSGAPEFTPVFSGVRVTRSLVLCVYFVDCCLSFCPFFFWPLCCMFFFNVRILITLWYLQTLLLSTSPPRYTSQSLKRIKLVATSNIWFVQRFYFNFPIISITHPSKPFQSFDFYQRFYIVILASHLNCINESTLFPHPIIGLVCTIRSNW
jgi:hypothetical protein